MTFVVDEIMPHDEIKQFKNVEDIILDLKNKKDRPLSFNDQEMEEARIFFNTVNYYSFTIYRKLLPRVENKKYSFSDCLELYNFNTFLRENLNRFTGQIELLLRASLIQCICEYYENKKREDKIILIKNHIRETVEMREKELIKKIKKTANKNVGFKNLLLATEKKLNGSLFSVSNNTNKISTKYSTELIDMLGKEAIGDIEKLIDTSVQHAINGIQSIAKVGKETFEVEIGKNNFDSYEDYSYLFSRLTEKYEQEILSTLQEKKVIFLQEASKREPSNMYKFKSGELYLDTAIYKKENDDDIKETEEIIKNFLEVIDVSKSDAIKHHKEKKIGVPLWVLFEEVTYGDVYHFVVSLEEEFQNAWIESFNNPENLVPKNSGKFILGWFRAINFLRNDCAHYNRLYGRYFTVSPPSLHKNDARKAGIELNNNKTLFAIMLTIKNLLGYNVFAVEQWNYFVKKLDERITERKDIIKIDRMGFPQNWKECLTIVK